MTRTKYSAKERLVNAARSKMRNKKKKIKNLRLATAEQIDLLQREIDLQAEILRVLDAVKEPA